MGQGLFENVKVVDFGWAVVGPTTVKYLADHGAAVIHIESSIRPDVLRVTPPFKDRMRGLNKSAYQACLNNNKYSLALNMKHSGTDEVIRRLIEWADIVAESFSPGVMNKWGLSYEDLKNIKSDIIMFSTSQQGQTGRHSKIAALGTQLVSLAGFTHLTGWPDRGPTGPYGPYTDTTAPPIGAAAIASALDYRLRTGKGIHIDLSQYEAALGFIAPVLLDFLVNKHIQVAQGNRSFYAVPHGIFPCKGDDRWCAITIFTDEEWQSLCHVMDDQEWTAEPRFATFIGRKKHEDDLEQLLAQWTINYDARELMYKLQKAGVPAGLVANGEDIQNDSQLAYRHYFWELNHTEIGRHSYERSPFKLSKSPAELDRPGSCLGADTEYVCTKILGMSDELFIQLLSLGVFR